MEIKKELLEGIMELSQSDWEKLKINIDYLYSIENKKRKETIFLNSKTVEDNLKYCPAPIHLQSE